MSFDIVDAYNEQENLQCSALRELCCANADYFMSHQDESYVRIRAALLAIVDHLEQLQPLYGEISKIAPLFDFDANTPGNGYRSFLSLVDKCIIHCTNVCRQINQQRNSILFRKTYHMREIEACSQLLASLCTCLQHVWTLYTWSETTMDGKLSLFPSDDHSAQELLNKAENINQYCFYGRCLGFQFCEGLRHTLKTLSLCMASYSEMYYNNGTLLGRCANSLKYVLDPEARARRIVNLSQRADISFCQAFWFLNELDIVYNFSVDRSLVIKQVISIPPEELTLPTLDGSTVSIPVPSSHIGRKPIHVKLLSAKRRVGMVGSGSASGELLGQSDSLIIHSHGGGFVAQTSRSHEVYLCEWALSLQVPILSIDYSLAPEAPYPRALEEVLYAYAWALKHASTLLGSTAKKIIFVGDSAGANLNLAATLRCIELNIRKPDGMFMLYAPVLIEFVPSPSRLLCLTDPLLPFGFMMRCLKAYAATDNKNDAREKEQDNDEGMKSCTESFAEVSESDLIALALSPNGEEPNSEQKLASLPSDSTLNSVSLGEVDGMEHPNNESKSNEYIKKFLDMYRSSGLGSSTSNVGSDVDRSKDITGNDGSWSFFSWPFGGNGRKLRELDTENGRSPTDEFAFTVPRDPLLSPYLAPDSVLRHLPPVKLLTTELDPCLDDCVMFARKLKALGNNVSLDVLSGLPHGFLNLATICKETKDGTRQCVTKLEELLKL